MYTFRSGLVVAAAAVLAGCTGTVESPGPGLPAGTGASNGTGAVGSGSGASNGTGASTGTGATTGTGAATGAGASGGSSGSGTGGAGGTDPTVCAPGVPATSQLPRLTRVQYDNTIRDLTGLATQPSSQLAPDTPGSVDQRAWDGYQAAADTVAAQIMADATARERVIPCTPDADGTACAQQMVTSFGQRAFRRPLTEAEVTRFMNLYTARATITANGTFDEAAQVIIKAFLLSPSFLTRAETAEVPDGAYYALSGHEIASRLSYMLWGSTPDDALLTSAANGVLSTPEGILAEAQRMLLDPKARAMVTSFHQQYAHMGAGTRWAAIQRDPALYPAFSEAMVPTLSAETERFFDYVVFDQGGTFQDLLTSTVAFVNSSTAPLYGVTGSFGTELTMTNLDPALRPGVFTRLGFLAAYSLYNRPSAILRGAFLQKEVLCTEIGAPPPGAEGTALPTEGLLTNRERTDAQTAAAECAGCHHAVINPTGYAMEAFDAIGAHQTTEKDTGAAINTAASVLIGATTVDVTGPADLMQVIAASPEAQSCYARRWVQFAYERAITSEDSCTVDGLAAKLTQGGYTVLNLIADLTQSQSFRYRAMEVAP